MKKIILGLAILAIITTTMTSCNRQGGGSQATVTLNLWHIFGDQVRGGAIQSAARRFEEANPGVRVVVTTEANDPYKIRLRTISADNFPDVFHSWGGGWLESFVDVGYVADITNEVSGVSNLTNPAMVELSKFNGRNYGIPYLAASTILYYNKDIFNRFGLQAPQTFSELERICEVLISNGIIPFAEANLTMWPGAQHFVFLAMRLGGGDIFNRANEGEVPFTAPAFVRAGEMIGEMVDKGWFPTGVNGLNWDTGQSRIMFYTEQAAMVLQTSAFIGVARQENRDFYDNKLGLSLYPAIEGNPGRMTDILGGANTLSVSANSRHPELARQLAIYIATEQQLHEEFLSNGFIAARPDLPVTDVHVRTALDQLASATQFQSIVDQTLSPVMSDIHRSTVQGLFGKTMTSVQAADAMQTAFEDEFL